MLILSRYFQFGGPVFSCFWSSFLLFLEQFLVGRLRVSRRSIGGAVFDVFGTSFGTSFGVSFHPNSKLPKGPGPRRRCSTCQTLGARVACWPLNNMKIKKVKVPESKTGPEHPKRSKCPSPKLAQGALKTGPQTIQNWSREPTWLGGILGAQELPRLGYCPNGPPWSRLALV